MTISSTVRKAGPFVGSGATATFPFAFKVFTASDLYVVKTNLSLGADTVLALTTDYTVSLNANQDVSPGGSITLVAGSLASGYNLTITSSLAYLQPTDLTNQGGFYPKVITNALDRLTIFCQQIYDAVNRSLKISVSTPDGVSTTLPVPVSNKLIGWNEAADGLQNMDPSTIATIVAFGTANADKFSGNGTTTQFVLSADPGALNNLDVSIGGVTQTPGVDYTWSAGTTITFTTAPPLGTNNVLVRYMQGLPSGIPGTGSVSDTTISSDESVLDAIVAKLKFLATGTGAIYRSLRDKLRDELSVLDYGAVGDGVTDDTAAVLAAINAANGRKVKFPAGRIYRITSSLSGTTAARIALSGETPAYITHAIINATQLNNDPLYRVTGTGTPGSSSAVSAALENAYMLATVPGVAIIKCDGCNLIGNPDTASLNGDTDKLKVLENLVLWGVNGAKHGVYSTAPSDQNIRDNTFVLFEHFGYLVRGGITTNMDRNGFVDCGWNLAHSGTATYPNTYTSGCAIKICSNLTPNDYTTINGAYRATTFRSKAHWVWQRGYTANNKSGLRGVQAHGLLSGVFDSHGGYMGDFFDICQVELKGYHYENYCAGGFAPNDHTPFNGYFLNCQAVVGLGFGSLVGAGVTAGLKQFIHYDTGNTSLPSWNSSNMDGGNIRSIGPLYSDMTKGTVVGPGGTTQTYLFKNIIRGAAGAGSFGFFGMVTVQLLNSNNFNNYSRGVWLVGSHYGSARKVFPPVQLGYESSLAGAFGATVSATFNGNDLEITVTFGASWGGAENWYLNVGLMGMPTQSV